MSFTINRHIKCCHPCVAPKRYPGCGDHCKEYQDERAQLDADKAEYYKQKSIQEGLDAQAIAGVERAKKIRKGRK